MKSQRQILLNLNGLAILICLSFFTYLFFAHISAHAGYFVIAALLYAGNMWLVLKEKFTIATISSIIVSNILVLLYDDGYKYDSLNCFVFYIPVFLFLYVILSYERRAISFSLFVITCACLGIANFTNWSAHIAQQQHKGAYAGAMKEINLASAALLCTLIVGGIIAGSKRNAKDLLAKRGELAAQHDTLSFIKDHINNGVFRITDEGIYICINAAFTNMLGYEVNEITGKSAMSLFSDKQKLNDMLALLKMGNFIVSKELELIKNDGSVFTATVSITRNAAQNGQVYYDGIVREINKTPDIKLTEAATPYAKEQAHFLSIVNHELRTPANTIYGISNHLLEQELEPEMSNDVEVLSLSSQNLVRVLDNIMCYNNLAKGSLSLKNRDFDLHALCHQALKSFQLKAVRKKVSIHSSIEPSISSHLKGDPSKLLLVMNNLLSNAVKFTDTGSVHLAINKMTETNTYIKLLFKITDTGIGIDTIHKPYLFDAFYQVNNSITRKYDGMGLGLYTSREILALMNTYIEIDSIPGRGTVVHFQLMLEKTDAIVDKKPETYNLKGIRILLVEDNKLNIFVARRFFDDKNVYLEVVENGAAAIDKIKNSTFDVILMDLHMPGMDGFTTTKEIRKINAAIPILAFSADASQQTKDKALSVGMDDFISKPFEPAQLFNKIRSLL